MTRNISLVNGPSSLSFRNPNSNSKEYIRFIIHGQGVFVFDAKNECSFIICNNDNNDGLSVSLTVSGFEVSSIKTTEKYISQMQPPIKKGFTTSLGAYYWFSLDSQNQRLIAGVGEPRIETACYKYQFADPKVKPFLESLVSIKWLGHESDSNPKPLRLLKNPVTMSIPLLVKNTNELCMEDIASNTYLPHATLSPEAQMLYNCVSGHCFTLDTPDFPDFSKAIEYSINTPGLWCYTRLKQKASEFGNPQPLETYLRITLGENNGESPGVPYVMEIWPVGHYSPIHNHGGANAIIRVLYGSIHVKLYPYLCNDASGVEPFAEKDFYPGDITWLSPTLNQVHQLKNLKTNKSTCITIQCYMYDKKDTGHYDYFDYLGDNNEKGFFEPDSDMDYIEFKNTIRKEWEKRPRLKLFNVYKLSNPELDLIK